MNIQLLHSSTKMITKTQMSEQEMLVVLKTLASKHCLPDEKDLSILDS